MTALYAREVFPKALNNSICVKFKIDSSVGVNASSGGTDLYHCSAFLFQCSILFPKHDPPQFTMLTPKLKHRVSWGLFDLLHLVLVSSKFCSKLTCFHVLVSALVQVPPSFNQCLGDILIGCKEILHCNRSGEQFAGAEDPWDCGWILRAFICHVKGSELPTWGTVAVLQKNILCT